MDRKKLIWEVLEKGAEQRLKMKDIWEEVSKSAEIIVSAYRNGGKVLIFGNGGSAADSQHIAAELVGRYKKDRPPLPAIALHTNTSTLTAVANDYEYDAVFERQVEAFGKKGDVAIGISTSGNSESIIRALKKAKSLGLKTIALTGGTGGKMAQEKWDSTVIVPADSTPRIQELHITFGHIIAEIVENEIFG